MICISFASWVRCFTGTLVRVSFRLLSLLLLLLFDVVGRCWCYCCVFVSNTYVDWINSTDKIMFGFGVTWSLRIQFKRYCDVNYCYMSVYHVDDIINDMWSKQFISLFMTAFLVLIIHTLGTKSSNYFCFLFCF